ncbi:hypothetical protein BH09PSE1_BH09PSE1_01090 [soil metagenome]
MMPFPPSDEVAFLLDGDAWVTQVVFNATTMWFQLANGCRIESELGLTYVSDAGTVSYEGEWFQIEAVHFLPLIEKQIVSVETKDLEMAITFENGARLIVRSEIGPYEAGSVLGPKDSHLGFYF